MESINESADEKYGDLTDKEYLEFLAEIEECDEEIEEAQNEAIKKIAFEEEFSHASDTEENNRIESYYGEDAWRKYGMFFFGKPDVTEIHKKIAKTKEKKRKKLKEERISIQRMAFRQEYIRLSDPIGNSNLKLLISLLTQEHTRMAEKYSSYINKKLALLLNPLIPRRLRICKAIYPESMKECPGFLYKASDEYGGGHSFWAVPNIPYFFKQNTEQARLQNSKHASHLMRVDKAIASYNAHIKAREEKEIKYASLLVRKKIRSYFDLLKLNPFWFELLFNNIKDKIDEL